MSFPYTFPVAMVFLLAIALPLLIIGHRTRKISPPPKLKRRTGLSFKRHDILTISNWDRLRDKIQNDHSFYVRIIKWGDLLTVDEFHLLIKTKLEDLGFEIIENISIEDALRSSPIRNNTYYIVAGLKGVKNIIKNISELYVLEELLIYKKNSDDFHKISIIAEAFITIAIKYTHENAEYTSEFTQLKEHILNLINKMKIIDVSTENITLPPPPPPA